MKGQITVEFLIILAVMTLLFSSISLDLANYALENAMVTQSDVLASESSSVLIGAFNQVYLQGSGAAKTVIIRTPADCNYTIHGTWVDVSCRDLTFTAQAYPTGFASFANISSALDVTYRCLTCGSDRVIPKGSAGLVRVEKS